jgi:predicted MFS family arabinose efflux permease
MAISAALGDLILLHASYRTMFVTSLAFCAIASGICWLLPEAPRAAEHEAEHQGLWRIALQSDLMPIWCATLAYFSCMAGVLSFLKTFVLATGYGSVGGFCGVYVLVALSLRVVLGSLPDRIGLRRMVLPAIGSYALGIVMLSLASGTASVLFAGAICGVGHGYGLPVLLSLVVSRAQPNVRGTATGLFSAIDWAGNLLAPPLLGALIERAGYATGFAALAAVGLTGIATFYALDRRVRAPSRLSAK